MEKWWEITGERKKEKVKRRERVTVNFWVVRCLKIERFPNTGVKGREGDCWLVRQVEVGMKEQRETEWNWKGMQKRPCLGQQCAFLKPQVWNYEPLSLSSFYYFLPCLDNLLQSPQWWVPCLASSHETTKINLFGFSC